MFGLNSIYALFLRSFNREPGSIKGAAATMERKIIYSEPAEYIPEHLRKLYKLGEYAEQKPEQQGSAPAQAQQPEDSTKAKQ